MLYVRRNDCILPKNSLLSQQQYGLSDNYSTFLAITDLYEHLLHKPDKKHLLWGFHRSWKIIRPSESFRIADKSGALQRKTKRV